MTNLFFSILRIDQSIIWLKEIDFRGFYPILTQLLVSEFVRVIIRRDKTFLYIVKYSEGNCLKYL
jgi:hypothetical protein